MLLLCPSLVLALDPTKAITQYGHTSWSSEQGLPQSAMTAILQGSDGYLWLTTHGGLVRFDGIQFTRFDRKTTNLPDNDVQTIVEDRQHHLWIAGPHCGLNEFRDGRFMAVQTRHISARTDIRVITADNNGGLWVGTIGQGIIYLLDGVEHAYTKKDGLPSNNISSLLVDRDGSLWIGTWEAGLSHLQNGRFTTYTKGGLPSNLVWSITQDKAGDLWIAAFGGLVRFSGGRFFPLGHKNGLPSDNVTGVFVDRDQNVWAATAGGGLSRLRNNRILTYTSDQGLSDDSLVTFAEDREGDLWVGTATGLDRFRDDKFTVYTKREGLIDSAVRTVYCDRRGALWIGTFSKGLDRFENGVITHFGAGRGLPDASILAIGEDGAGNLWVGCGGGIVAWLDAFGQFHRFPISHGSEFQEVTSLKRDSSGQLLLGTFGGGVLRLTHNGSSPFLSQEGLRNIIDLQSDSQGGLWIASVDRGLVHTDASGQVTQISEVNKREEFPRSLYLDHNQTLWLGLNRGGIAWIRDGKLCRKPSGADNLDDAVILGFLEDDRGDLWTTTEQGIFRLSARYLSALTAGAPAGVPPLAFSRTDGLTSIHFGGFAQPAIAHTPDGRMWFATSKGVATIHPSRITLNSVPPPVTIERIEVDSTTVKTERQVILSPGVRRLTIRYAGLSFKAPEAVHFRYKLEGYDPDWLDPGARREAFYTGLKPGRYRFLVKAANSDGVWNSTPAEVLFQLRPYFYQTSWFLGLCCLALLAFICALHQLRMRVVRSKLELAMEERLGERTRIAQEIHDTLLQNLISVGWQLQAITSATPPIPERLRKTLHTVMQNVDNSVREVRLSIFNLRTTAAGLPLTDAVERNIQALIGNTELLFQAEVTGQPFRLPQNLELEVLRISQESAMNVVRHARARNLRITLHYERNTFTLSVQDDGVGFDPEVSVSNTHFGLTGMRERAKRVGGNLFVQSKPGTGTTIVMLVELKVGSGNKE
jgi:ligand-binding sensor domain-containing protein/signal transduction histidine kinase